MRKNGGSGEDRGENGGGEQTSGSSKTSLQVHLRGPASESDR
jgi:hypothetical protein